MWIIKILEDDYFERLKTPFNPPDASVSDSDFECEYFRLYNKLTAILSEFGKEDPYGTGDYCIEPNVGRSRDIGFEVNNDKFVTQTLLVRLKDLITSNAPNWEIHLRSERYTYGILINSVAIYLNRSSDELLHQLKLN